jgi:hypothetical protein
MNQTLQTWIQSAKSIIHLDHYHKIKYWRFVIHSIVLWCLILLTWWRSIQESLIAILFGIATISYIPFITIELYHRPIHRQWYWYGGIAITALRIMSGIFDPHLMINALWSAGFLTIGRWVWDYCVVVRRRKTRHIYNQVSTIGIFLISIIFAIITMRRFQSINFSCDNVNFLSTQFVNQFTQPNSDHMSPVTQIVSSGGRANYLQALDGWLITSSGDNSWSNLIKTQVRNSVIIVMDQKKLYDKSICDYVTTALNDNYQKPSFFYSWVLLLTFIGLPAARIALILIASIFSLILWILQRLGIYRSHATLIEQQVLE